MYDEIEAMRYYGRRRPYGRRYYPYSYGYYRPYYYPRRYYYNPYAYYGRPYYNPYRRRRRPGRLYGVEVGVWDPDMAYTGGDTVIYDGREYQAKWYNQGEEPNIHVTSQWDTPWKEL